MAATVEFSESNGLAASEVVTDGISNINFGTADSPNLVPASHPILVGGYSYGKWIRFHVVNMGGSSQISDLRMWKSSGAYKAGETIGGNIHTPVATYVITAYAHRIAAGGGTPVVTPIIATGATVMTTDYDINAVPTSLGGNANIGIAGTDLGLLTLAGQYSDYVFLGVKTTGIIPAGPVNQKIFTIQYDEI